MEQPSGLATSIKIGDMQGGTATLDVIQGFYRLKQWDGFKYANRMGISHLIGIC